MKSRRTLARRASGPLAAALALVALQPGIAEGPWDDEPGPPALEVFVTDKKGNPITDLELADFEIRVDRQAASVVSFRKVLDGRFVEADGETEVPRRVVVLFDLLHLTPASRNQMVKRLRTFLPEQAGAGVEVMVASSNGSLSIHESFTTDTAEIRQALGVVERQDAAHVLPSERLALDCLFGNAGHPNCARVIQQYNAELYERTVAALPPLEALALDLGNVPGHKWVLYVAEGLPLRPGEEVQEALGERVGVVSDGHGHDLTSKIDTLTEAANSNGVGFYTYRGTGLSTGVASVSAANPFQPNDVTTLFDTTRQRNFQSGPTRLSIRTGGWVANSQKEVLARLAGDLSAFYSLVFSADVATRGSYHDVKIKVDRKKTIVRHPDGYYDDPVKNPEL